MAVIAMTSLAGAPGVTTSTVAWALHSQRPTLIVEADVTGGSAILAGVWEGTRRHQPSILALASADPQDYRDTIYQQAQLLPECDDRWVLPAVGSGVQAASMLHVWGPLSATLAEISRTTGVDVLVDAGRLGMSGSAWPLIDAADAVLLFTDSTTPALNAAHIALPTLRAELDASGSHERLAVVPVLAPPGPTSLAARLSGRAEAGRAMRQTVRGQVAASVHPTKAIAGIRYDPRAASVYSDGMPTGRFTGSYVHDIERLIEATDAHIRRYRALLGVQEGTRP